MKGLLEGKVALVTGGGSGIGRQTALLLAEEQARVAVCDRDATSGEQTAAEVARHGGDALFVGADTSEPDDARRMVESTVSHFGRLDAAVNGAAIVGEAGNTVEATLENWNAVIDVNVKGVWLSMKYEIGAMLLCGGGAIVNMSSDVGLGGLPERAAYSASKHAVIGLTRTAALEFARQGIRVNAVCPGATRTPMHSQVSLDDPAKEAATAEAVPLGRLAEPREVAETIVWLCSDRSSFITGASLLIDGGRGAR